MEIDVREDAEELEGLQIDTSGMDYMQINEIHKGINSGLNVAVYADAQFDWFQMAEIREGLELGLDVAVYAKPEFDYLAMREIKLSLIDRVDIMDYARLRYSGSVLKQLRIARTNHVNIEAYIRERYDGDQLVEIRHALEAGINPDGYISTAYFGSQIKEICLGLQSKVAVSVYTTGEYNWFQMREIRLGLEEHLDVSCYARPLLDYRQMKEIRLGLEAGVDAKSYAKIAFSPERMMQERAALLEEISQLQQKKAEQKFRQDEEEALQREGLAAEENKHLPSQEELLEYEIVKKYLLLRISEDKMSAYLSCLALDIEHPYFDETAVFQYLKENKVTQGVDKAAVHQMASSPEAGKELLVARGKQPVNGKNGYFVYLFRTEMPTKPKILADGSVDYHNMDLFEEVSAGQKLAHYEPATDGTYGFDVTGQLMKPIKGTNQSMLRGTGFQISEDRRDYYAAVDGKIELRAGTMLVTKLYVVNGNLDLGIGNIHFDGDVCVKGDVLGAIKIVASGNIKITGHVENAYIESGIDCIIAKGMQGAGSGRIRSGGCIYGSFFEYTNLEAKGNIYANYLFNCNTSTEEMLLLSGQKGKILGGNTQAVKGIESYILGNVAQTRTELNIGVTKNIEESYQKNTEKARTIQEEINTFKKGKLMFENRMQANELSLHETYGKILTAIEMKQEEYANCLREEERLMKLMNEGKGAKIQCKGVANAGIRVTISDHDLFLTKRVTNVYFCLNEDHVAIFKI